MHHVVLILLRVDTVRTRGGGRQRKSEREKERERERKETKSFFIFTEALHLHTVFNSVGVFVYKTHCKLINPLNTEYNVSLNVREKEN